MAAPAYYVSRHRYAAGEPGRYVCERAFDWQGKRYSREVECNNPVVGQRALDDWEAGIIDPPGQKRDAA